MRNSFFTIIVCLFMLCSCVGSKPLTSSLPPESKLDSPAKQVPISGKIPPTQRPYKIKGKRYYPLPTSDGYEEKGIASWYGKKFHGRKTSNGETYDMYGMTAAHKTLPMNTMILVKNTINNKEIVVRVNDRGPFVRGRIVDLTHTGAKEIGMVEDGTAPVKLTALGEARTFKQGNREVERFLPHQDFESGEFFVQIGSFKNKDNAENLKSRMLAWGRKAVIQTYDRGDTVFYRVQVRAGKKLPEAKRTERVLDRAGYTDSFVVAR
ncbi:septal ring lytic transglycosylase RlpA family protein [Thermodesulfobacteriota bacterium]